MTMYYYIDPKTGKQEASYYEPQGIDYTTERPKTGHSSKWDSDPRIGCDGFSPMPAYCLTPFDPKNPNLDHLPKGWKSEIETPAQEDMAKDMTPVLVQLVSKLLDDEIISEDAFDADAMTAYNTAKSTANQ